MYTRETLVKSSQYRCSEIKLTCTKSHVDCPDIWMIINSKPLTNRSKLVSWRSSSSGPNLVMTALNSVCSNLSKKIWLFFWEFIFFLTSTCLQFIQVLAFTFILCSPTKATPNATPCLTRLLSTAQISFEMIKNPALDPTCQAGRKWLSLAREWSQWWMLRWRWFLSDCWKAAKECRSGQEKRTSDRSIGKTNRVEFTRYMWIPLARRT